MVCAVCLMAVRQTAPIDLLLYVRLQCFVVARVPAFVVRVPTHPNQCMRVAITSVSWIWTSTTVHSPVRRVSTNRNDSFTLRSKMKMMKRVSCLLPFLRPTHIQQTTRNSPATVTPLHSTQSTQRPECKKGLEQRWLAPHSIGKHASTPAVLSLFICWA